MSIGQLLFGFEGRIRRTNYWLGALGSGAVLGIVAIIVMMVLGGGAALMMHGAGASDDAAGGVAAIIAGLVYLVVLVISVWISLALQIKRWHDRDKSGVWVFINFIPLVGGIWSLIECGFMDGTMGPNRFGPSPKGFTGPPPMQPGAMPPPVQPMAPPPVI